MKILVIGGAGYIGSHVARLLLDNGHAVTVYDNLSFGQPANLFPDAEFVRADILDSKSLEGCMRGGFDAVVHLAALKAAGESMTSPEKYATNNISGTINILNAMTLAGVNFIVFSSSAAVYGEPQYLPIDERHPQNPGNFYGVTKVEIERLLAWYDKLKGMRYAALRYFNAAGYDPEGRIKGLERKPANLLPTIMEVAVGWRPALDIFGNDYQTPDGTCIRDYIHVSDLASAHLKALLHIMKGNPSIALNLGSETGLSVLEIVGAARRITGKPIPATMVPRRPGDPARLVASAARAKELLGWEAHESGLETLVSSTWKAYQAAAAKQ